MGEVVNLNVDKPKYIIVSSFGDINTHFVQKTSVGLFDTRDEAEKYVVDTYAGTNYICEVLPLNNKSIFENENDTTTTI
tara:strand:- start:871 stop:1107 length:237 start_codon:yes stop_codon:yes gene_type:complete